MKRDKQQAVIGGFENLMPIEARGKLQEKFLVPPFSILDTKQGYWQDRKRMWISLGIKSEIGRGSNLSFPEMISEESLNHYRNVEKEKGHGQITKEAVAYKAQDSLNKIMQDKGYRDKVVPGTLDKNDKAWKNSGNSFGNIAERFATGENLTDTAARIAGIGTGTSIFDPVLCELMYKWFCPVGGNILDPFAGGSVRGIVAGMLGYKYYGIDLSEKQVFANRAQTDLIIPDKFPKWYIGNSKEMDDLLPDEPEYYDFAFSCPPYHDLEQYTDDMEDLSNMSWRQFKIEYNEIIEQVVLKLKDNRFACFVVSEIRNEVGFFKGFVPYTVQCFHNAGAQFYNELILVNVVGSLPVRVANSFGGNRKIGRMHQNVLVFYKGDPEKISDNYKSIDTGDI